MTHEERERSLQAIGDVIEHWLTWVQRECDAEGLETTADTHIMFGYEGAPPCWPSVGQLKRWLEVFRATPAVAPEGQVTEAGLHKLIEAARIYEASCRLGGKEQEFASRKLDEAKAALTTVAPADDDAELRALAADLCRAMRVDVGQITLHWAETFLRERLASKGADDGPKYWERPFGDAGDAIDYALGHIEDPFERSDFLDCWRQDNVGEWPEYLRWLKVQQEGAKAAALSPPQATGSESNA